MTLAHPGEPLVPHDVWRAWNADPLIVAGLLVAVWLYRRGRRVGGRPRVQAVWRGRCFTAAMVAVGVALVSPLDALSGALASAHMVQHLLLVLVAAPLLALSAPSSTLLRGTPLVVRQTAGRWRRRLGLGRRTTRAFEHPATAWLLHAGTLWFWHAAVPYGAALDHHVVHVVEHATFLLSGLLFWRILIGSRAAGRVSPGLGVLLLFGMSMQSVFLSVLLTFARSPWYEGYAATTIPWSLEPLADQQLAGVIMWIPAGLVYVATALALLADWIRRSEPLDGPLVRLGPDRTDDT